MALALRNGNNFTLSPLRQRIRQIDGYRYWGRVTSISPSELLMAGPTQDFRIGDLLTQSPDGHEPFVGEVIKLDHQTMNVMRYADDIDLEIGAPLYRAKANEIFPSLDWTGRIMDSFGHDTKTGAALPGEIAARLDAKPPIAATRRPLGNRLKAGLSVFNTILPLCRGQRVGLFAAAGLGKSSLMAEFARALEADITIVALIGERGREVNEFASKAIRPENKDKTILFAATSEAPAALKRRTAYAAMACAEHFRREGKHVLLLFDSLTRFADAHREVALAAGEPPALRAYPPSLASAIAGLAERAGPGPAG